ncbi:MAG: hypothetical protein IJF18_01395 [Oscillospiraceae bacterium]|nr:hypothetical protein [Oscillospiraceae bacterium]
MGSILFNGEINFADDSDLNLDYETDEYEDDDEEDEIDEDYLRDEYEYYDEWLQRDPELYDMSLDEYEEMRCMEDYGDDTYDSDYDDDSYDPYY